MNIALIVALFALALCVLACIIHFLGKRGVDDSSSRPHFKLIRHDSNPVISPLSISEWQVNGTFNPAAFKDDDDCVHLLYRAIGADGVSRVGYASSDDGLNFNDRSIYPVFEHAFPVNLDQNKISAEPSTYNPAYYTSGGSWGGAEDPRAVKIGSKVYVSYVAFEGWDSVRIALTSIGINDLKKKRWQWRRPVLISSPKETNKNWVIFPEKINGKYAILHSLVPKIMIEYVDSLDYMSEHISSPRPQGPQPGRQKYWDNTMRGAGAPPILTDKGWLLLYHAIDKKDSNKYKVGAMLLDRKDPTKILFRSPQPILEPDMHYENDGKPGVVYASGAVILKDNLMIYYGGGDRHVCIAQTPVKQLLEWLETYGRV